MIFGAHDAGGGNDEVVVNNISDATTIETGSGTDEIIIGQDGLVVSGIGADLTITGSNVNSDDRVTLLNNADAGDAAASNSRDGVLTDTTISELNMGGDINYTNVDELNVFLGGANDLHHLLVCVLVQMHCCTWLCTCPPVFGGAYELLRSVVHLVVPHQLVAHMASRIKWCLYWCV